MGASLGPGPLLLALSHGIAAAIFLLTTNYDLGLTPIGPVDTLLAVMTIIGLLCAVVGAAALAWTGAAALARRVSASPGFSRKRSITAERWALEQIARHGALTLLLVTLLWLQLRFMGSGDVVASIFTALWFCAALSCGAARLLWVSSIRMRGLQTRTSAALLDERSALPSADALLDVAPPTWTFLVVIEAIFHSGAGTWVPMAEVSALLRNMSDEAGAMLLGPEAGRLAGLIGAFLLVAVLWALAWRLWRPRQLDQPPRDWRRRLPAIWASLVLLGLVGLIACPTRTRRLVVHHSHPSLHLLAGVLGTGLAIRMRQEAPGAAAAAARLFPDALDDGGLPALPAVPPPDKATATAAPLARNALLIFIDTLSRRSLEAWGYDRPVAPNLARLASESIRFNRARSNASQTDLSTISLFYSLLPLIDLDKRDTYRRGHGGTPVHLHAAQAGFAVGVFSADWEVHDRGHGALHPGRCDAFVDAREANSVAEREEIVRWAGRREDKLVQRFLKWHEGARAAGRRTFSYFKFLRPHGPYYTPPDDETWQRPFKPAADGFNVFDFRPGPARAKLLRARYDNAINYADNALGTLLTGLRRSGALTDTAIILIADHGEAWGEHGIFGHSTAHFEEVLDVPLLLRLPDGRSGADERLAATIDVAPTLLDALGLAPDPSYQGRSLLDASYDPQLHFAWSNNVGPIASLIVRNWKLIWIPSSDERWLYDLDADPAERNNLAGSSGAADRESALMFLLHRLCRSQLRKMAALREASLGPLARRASSE